MLLAWDNHPPPSDDLASQFAETAGISAVLRAYGNADTRLFRRRTVRLQARSAFLLTRPYKNSPYYPCCFGLRAFMGEFQRTACNIAFLTIVTLNLPKVGRRRQAYAGQYWFALFRREVRSLAGAKWLRTVKTEL